MLSFEAVAIPMGAATLAVDLALEPGARVAVIGPSGAGKSTLLDALAGFRAVTSGRILWNGAELTALPPEARPVSILFQDGNLFPHLDVARNLSLALRPDGGRADAAARGRIADALGQVGLEGFEARMPGALSGGQAGRVALARVLLQDRPILLLDEPFAALGPALKREMLALVGDVADRLGALTLLVTHDPQDAVSFGGSVLLVADNAVQPPVAAERLFVDPPAALRAYLGR